jgi:Right handed beta helix region
MDVQVTKRTARTCKRATAIGAQQELGRAARRRRPLLALTFSAILSLIVAAVVITAAQARTYFVATTGNDANAGTITSPWLTLSHAVAQLAPGDTLWIRGGTYTGSANAIDSTINTVPGGTSTASITIGAYNSGTLETVILQGGSGASGSLVLDSATQSYLIIQDLILDGTNLAGNGQVVYIGPGVSHITLLRDSIRNSPNFGMLLSPLSGGYISVLNCSIYSNGSGSLATNGHGIYNESSHLTVQGCAIHDNVGYGINNDSSGDATFTGTVIRDNLIYNNGRSGQSAYGISDGWSTGSQIYNNLLYNNQGGIIVYSKSSGALVANNTIYNSSQIPGGGGAGGGGIDLQYYASPPTVENNIVYGNARAITDYGGTGTPTIANNLSTNPSFVNSASTPPNLQVQAGSSAISAGTYVAAVPLDILGNTRANPPTIGAYEYIRPATPPSPPAGFTITAG